MAQYYIIRHGETDLNRRGLLQGRSNSPLNETGKEQARYAAIFLAAHGIRFDRIYTSPAMRAIETGMIVTGGNVEFKVSDDLMEMDYGPYEGTSLRNMPPELVTFFEDFNNNPAPEGMEKLEDVVKRTKNFMESIASEREGTILISTHAIAMKGILEALTPGANGYFWSYYIGNCGIYRTVYENGRFSVPEEFYPEKKDA